jgi:Lar family restriction alleviation protein
MSDKLKPCPFCGGEAELFLRSCNGVPSGDVVTEAEITCNKCDVKFTRWALNKIWAKKSVIEAWNRRVEK